VKSVVHEIRNHLAVAVANVEAFRDGILDPSPQRLAAVLQALQEAEVLLGEISAGIGRSGETVDSPAAMVPINLCRVVTNELVGFEGAALRAGIDLHVHQCATPDELCETFIGDPVRIGEIVTNVVSNAIRYTPHGGRIEIDCRTTDGSLVLTVSDNGPGVALEDRAHIFEAGYRGTASRGRSGSGLGLGIARRFVEAHGGTIELADDGRAGASFVITLPGVRALRALEDGTLSLLES
jgi:two-component system sensor histidine kinase BaeS